MYRYYKELKSAELEREAQLMTPSRIRAIRRSYKLTQVSFAALIDVAYSTYRNWEIGYRKPSTPAVAILLVAEASPTMFVKRCRRAQRAKAKLTEITK